MFGKHWPTECVNVCELWIDGKHFPCAVFIANTTLVCELHLFAVFCPRRSANQLTFHHVMLLLLLKHISNFTPHYTRALSFFLSFLASKNRQHFHQPFEIYSFVAIIEYCRLVMILSNSNHGLYFRQVRLSLQNSIEKINQYFHCRCSLCFIFAWISLLWRLFGSESKIKTKRKDTENPNQYVK